MPRTTTFTSAALAVAGLLMLALNGCDDADGSRASASGSGADAATQASARTEGPKGFTGVFHTSADGTRSVLNLTDHDGKLTGMLDAANISGQIMGDSATGDVKDAATAAKVGTVDLSLSGDALVLTLTAIDAWGGPSLRMPAVTYTRGAPPPIDVQRDTRLAGRWRHTWAAGDAGATVDLWLVVKAEGEVEYGKSAAAGGSDAVAAIETAADAGFAGKWRTNNHVLHVMPGGNSHWVAFARYDVEGEKLTLTFNDGSRQTYYRQ